nr:unnamed protein product [Haemonchus contortus]
MPQRLGLYASRMSMPVAPYKAFHHITHKQTFHGCLGTIHSSLVPLLTDRGLLGLALRDRNGTYTREELQA